MKDEGKGCWLLVRRSIAKPEELAYYACFGPAGTTLEELVEVARTRWAIEECFEESKSQVGLDQYEVRRGGTVGTGTSPCRYRPTLFWR